MIHYIGTDEENEMLFKWESREATSKQWRIQKIRKQLENELASFDSWDGSWSKGAMSDIFSVLTGVRGTSYRNGLENDDRCRNSIYCGGSCGPLCETEEDELRSCHMPYKSWWCKRKRLSKDRFLRHLPHFLNMVHRGSLIRITESGTFGDLGRRPTAR